MSRTFGVKKELLFETCRFLKLLKTVTVAWRRRRLAGTVARLLVFPVELAAPLTDIFGRE